jgi:acetyl-CoA carboxylase biotin carboxylase subunit
VIPPYYNSLVAKLIAHGLNRAERQSREARAHIVVGIYTSIPLHERILEAP